MEDAIVPRQGVSLHTFAHVAVTIGQMCEYGCLHACVQCWLRSRKELGMMSEIQDVSVQPVDTCDRRSSSGNCQSAESIHW